MQAKCQAVKMLLCAYENQICCSNFFIALDEQGMDPCDNAVAGGDKEALQEIINNHASKLNLL